MQGLRIVRYLSVIIAWAMALPVTAVSAAELRITLPELATVVQAVMGDAKLHLNNSPADF